MKQISKRACCATVWFAPVGLMDNLQNIDIISWLFPILATDKLLFRYANKANTDCLCSFTAKYIFWVKQNWLLPPVPKTDQSKKMKLRLYTS